MSDKGLISSVCNFFKGLFSSTSAQEEAPLKPRIVGTPPPESEETAISMSDFEGYIQSQPISMAEFEKNISK